MPSPSASPAQAFGSWARHPVLAAGLELLALVAPGLVGVVVGLGVIASVEPPSGMLRLLVLLAAVTGGVVATIAADRALRRLLPLVVLLRLSLDFPDRAPSRLRVALRSGTLRHLDEQLAKVAAHGVEGSPSEAAGRILELMAALARYDRRTRGHSERVRAFTDVIADELHLSRLDHDRLRWAALLHDIGKLHVDVAILNKVGGLSGDEWQAVRAHPHVGARIAEPLLPWLGEWGAAIEHHHERWDGRGYPHGCAGTDIPLGARIVAVADAFEVMTAARSYKRPMSVPAARTELLSCAGEQFDPKVVRALLQASVTRLRWIVGPAALLLAFPRASRAYGATRRFGELPAVRAAVTAVVATLSLPAVDVPMGGSDTAGAGEGGAVTARAAASGGASAGAATAGSVHQDFADIRRFDRLLRQAIAAAAAEVETSGSGGDAAIPTSTDGDHSRSGHGDTPANGAGGPAVDPPGETISSTARSGGDPDHGERVSTVAQSTEKPSGR